jgi:hypothetical protein
LGFKKRRLATVGIVSLSLSSLSLSLSLSLSGLCCWDYIELSHSGAEWIASDEKKKRKK